MLRQLMSCLAVLWAFPTSRTSSARGPQPKPAKQLDVRIGPVSGMPFVELEVDRRKGPRERREINLGCT